MADALPITVKGKQKLETELKRLLSEERPNVVRAIEEARSHGDLSENADYDAAKERQGWIEARIGEIQGMLAGAQVVDVSKIKSDKIVFGATVDLIDLDKDEKVTYTIVGVDEADVKSGTISIVSPLARAMIGKTEGDVVEVRTAASTKEYEISGFCFK